jgi:lipid A disaccharide synthetase
MVLGNGPHVKLYRVNVLDFYIVNVFIELNFIELLTVEVSLFFFTRR